MGAKTSNESPKAISTKLSLMFVALLLVSILVAEGLTFALGYRMIRALIYTSLENEVSADAAQVNKELTATFYYLNGVADAIEQTNYGSNDEIMSYLTGTVGRYKMIPTGAYLMLNDETFLYPSEPDFSIENITQNVMYVEAVQYTNSWFYYYDEPYFDTVTGALCSSVLRHVHLQDGREGCFAADLMLSNAQEKLNEVELYKTGGAMMVTASGLILSYKDDPSLCGSNVADVPDNKFLQAIGKFAASEAESETHDVTGVKINGEKYFLVSSGVSGTDWSVIIYAKQKEVLATLQSIVIVLILVTLASVLIVIFVMNFVLKGMIKKPVTSLTDNIGKISNGDFTVNIKSNGNDEIAYMNKAMGEFVDGMRSSLGEIKDVSGRLLGMHRLPRALLKILKKQPTISQPACPRFAKTLRTWLRLSMRLLRTPQFLHRL